MTLDVQVAIARLPATQAELFGRDEELAWLDACWADGVHVASLVAFGGVGKTALVNRWLAGMRDKGWDRADRVYGWSFYSQGTDRLSSSDEFIDAALEWFGEKDRTQGSAWDKGERLARLVREQRTLLILDGVEPLQWGPGVQLGKLKDPALEALVKELGAHNQGLCLMTSRLKLADLDSMGGYKVRAKDLGSLSAEAGAELLKARGAKGADEELREAAREYKGHGLALTLLGSFLADVAKSDIQRRREIGPLTEDERQGGHARRVITAYEAWLGQLEIAILRMIGLFDRSVDEGEITALRNDPVVPGLTDALVGVRAPGWNKAVAKLQRAGLLSVGHDKRLDAHPLVREHFGEQLKRDHVEAWREGHRRLYVYLKKKAKPLPDTIEEMAPLYAAVVHGCLAGKNQEALVEVYWKRMLRANEKFNWRTLGAFGSEVAVLSAFFDPPWERLAPGLSERDQTFVLIAAGFALRALGRMQDAEGPMRLSVEQSIDQKNWRLAALRASTLSDLLLALGDLSEALTHALKSVELGDESGDAATRIVSRATLAATWHAMGLREDADAQFEKAERMQEENHPAAPLLDLFQGFQYCDLLLDQNRDAEVRERAKETLKVAEHNHSLLDIALDHLSLGRAHLLAVQHGTVGDVAQATSHLEQAVEGLRRASRQDYLPLGLLARAALYTHTRDFPAARHDLDDTLTLAIRCGFLLHEADAHLGLARLALTEHTPAPAREHLATARRIVYESGYHRRDGELTALDAEAIAMAEPEPPPAPVPAPPLAPMPMPTLDFTSTTPARATVNAMLLLDPTVIYELCAAAVSSGLVHRRTALLSGIDRGLVAGLPSAENSAAQLLVDLNELNELGALDDGTVPLHTWLASAAPMAGVQREAALFEHHRDRLAPFAPPRTTASTPPPAPLLAPPAQRIVRSMPTQPTASQPIDLGIIVALPEELREMLDLAKHHVSHPDCDIDAFLFTRGPYHCAVTLVGEMGETQAGVFTERLISALGPGAIVSIGIAGGVHADLRAGDVHVPSQAAQYLQDAKASTTADGGFAIKPGAPAYRADFALHKAARGFEFHHAAEHRKWQAECAADFALLLKDATKRDSLVSEDLVRAEVKLLADGHVATGPVVGAAAAFSAWIRATQDRNVKSLEMETAAVLLAAQTRHEPKRALAIRGISDYGDDRKQAFDRIGVGALRRYAMRNAMRFLLALLDAEVLPRNPR